ncbi:MAG: HK97 family phage prohead protease [Lachnotalea sp.]
MPAQVTSNEETKVEQRSYVGYQQIPLELRAAAEGQESRTIGGYAVKFNMPVLIQDRWGDEYLEEIATGCFDESIRDCKEVGKEIKALWNHDSSKPLGSTKIDTLRFNTSDTTGLSYDIDLPNNTWGSDVKESVQRGDVDGSSFGFICLEDQWSKVQYEGREIYKRSIVKAELHEVSPCTFPAYDSSQINCRSFDKVKKEAKDEVRLKELEEELKLLDLEDELEN